jgi:hypothetical protein
MPENSTLAVSGKGERLTCEITRLRRQLERVVWEGKLVLIELSASGTDEEIEEFLEKIVGLAGLKSWFRRCPPVRPPA